MTESAVTLPVTLVFHKLLEGLTLGITNYSPDRFARLLLELGIAGWGITSPDVQAAQRQGRGVIVSFDDGYDHLARILPILMKDLALRPIVFVPAALLGKANRWDYTYHFRKTPHLSRDQVLDLVGSGVVFGSHGASHCDLTSCTPFDLRRELEYSRKTLQDLTGQEIDSVSYPFGRFSQQVIEAAQQAGFRRGFTMRLPREDDHPLSAGRVPVYSYDTTWSVRRKLDPGPASWLERFKVDTVNRLSCGTILLNRLRRFKS